MRLRNALISSTITILAVATWQSAARAQPPARPPTAPPRKKAKRPKPRPKPVTTLQVVCTQRGVHVRLDNLPPLACPVDRTFKLEPGLHALAAEGKGFLKRRVTFRLRDGEKRTERVSLGRIAPRPRIVRKTRKVPSAPEEPRWPRAVPWAVLGAGLALAVVGAALIPAGWHQLERYDERYAEQCNTTCNPVPDDVARLHDRGQAMIRSGIALAAIGAAAAITGVVLVVSTPKRTKAAVSDLRIQPAIGPGSAQLNLQFRF